nr:uncharacterized protein CI109_000345 [Kwoniella shandongensis]KAA5531503.1 hypothetical protein CI109_000345 [Kwoniella shandongensis]
MSRICHTCRSLASAQVRAHAPARAFATAITTGKYEHHLPPKRARPILPKLGRRTPTTQSLPTLLKTLSDLKSKSRRPTPSAYITIIKAAGDYALGRNASDGDETEGLGWQVAMAAWDDAKRGGIDLGTDGIESLMRFSVIYPHLLPSLLLYSDSQLASSYQAMIKASSLSSNLEQTFLLITEMFARDITPLPATLKASIRIACEWGCPRLALQLAQKVETESSTGQRIDRDSWFDILVSSADSQYLHGVETAWDRVKSSYTPDEGLVLAMLNTAGRWGRPDFASTILESLPTSPQEHHLAPLLEAFCNAGQVPNAFHVLSSIRASGLTPTLATIQPIVTVLKDAEVIDQAFYALEDMHKAGQPVDITALNALIEASARLGDLQRVRATQIAASDLGLKPDVDTFNGVLACCITTRHRPLGDTVLSEMVASDITPNAKTYETLILLCLTQATYEDAFYYLEKTKADGFKPSYAIYEALIRKCVTLQDSRWRLVVDEMKEVGYRMDSELHEFVNSGGKTRRRDEKGRRRMNDEMVGSKRRQWIGQSQRDSER